MFDRDAAAEFEVSPEFEMFKDKLFSKDPSSLSIWKSKNSKKAFGVLMSYKKNLLTNKCDLSYTVIEFST